jgi:hypothetical protein
MNTTSHMTEMYDTEPELSKISDLLFCIKVQNFPHVAKYICISTKGIFLAFELRFYKVQ